ncbi:MAG: hypothetical protein ACTHN0_07520 [Aquihabitans sp.]
MAEERKVTTAAELEAMTPEERRLHFRASIVTDLDDLTPTTRAKILATGERLARERRTARDM